MELLNRIVVRSDIANWRIPPPWPIALGIGIMPIALIDDQPGLPMSLAVSVLVLMVAMMTWLALAIARRLWCDRHPYLPSHWLVAARTDLGKPLINAALIRLRDTTPCGQDRVLRRGEMIEAILAERDALVNARKAAKGVRLGDVAGWVGEHPLTRSTA